MKQGECWCNENDAAYWLRDADHKSVIGLDGAEAMLRVRISPDQGRAGLPITCYPLCGRQLANDGPRCPENLNAKVVKE